MMFTTFNVCRFCRKPWRDRGDRRNPKQARGVRTGRGRGGQQRRMWSKTRVIDKFSLWTVKSKKQGLPYRNVRHHLVRHEMTFPHQRSAEGTVFSPTLQCKFRSLAYLKVHPFGPCCLLFTVRNTPTRFSRVRASTSFLSSF